MATYKLSCTLTGHELDVRAVQATFSPEGAIVSGSRDKTARIWVPDSNGRGYSQAMILTGHTNFISCICVMPPTDEYPQGLIMTGSNDHNINAYTPDSPFPVYTLTGHENTVCTLASGKFGTLLSGSWDCTAKVWLKEKNVMTLRGHSLAVWAVAILPAQGLMLTGSADKDIKMWRTGKCERTFKGHNDCVRSIAVLSEVEFLSASNDASIRRWLTTGECIQEYYAHTNYVYSLAILQNGTDFATTSEDRTLRIWRGSDCTQTIRLPAQSVWSVTALPNGDIAVGSSDNMVRVFTTSAERTASPDEIDMFEKQVASSALNPQSDDLGKIKIDELPGPESLNKPGNRDGQTTMVKVGENKVEAYSWSATENKWNKIGDVVGSAGASEGSKGKTMFEGQEYDYVFSVDIEDGKPPLKLPYNITEDPWFAAQKFLQRNELSPLFLDQVANFIVENTKGTTLGSSGPVVSDPFTGGSRYIPGGGSGSAPQVPRPGTSDPFTGGSRYKPGGAAPAAPSFPAGQGDPLTGGNRYIPGGSQPLVQAAAPSSVPSNPYFPKTTHLTFDSANIQAVLGKLKELNRGLDDPHKVDESQLDEVVKLADKTKIPTAQQMEILWKILQWPADVVFPGLDVLRLAICNDTVAQHFCNAKDGPQFLAHLCRILTDDPKPANQLLVLRTFCNAFVQPLSHQLLMAHLESVVSSSLQCNSSSNRNVRLALSTLCLNYSISLHAGDDAEAKSQCMSLVVMGVEDTDNEVKFRHLVALGNLISNDENAKAMALSLDLLPLITRSKSISDPAKVGDCARYLEGVLS
ncbi:phospholipase A-2-activating protein-like [Ptychodera flava]|uniref:phospholipase A-2-activating protein-like n=1 Tax=Ptychodera flava TaxID=63121 RepID=UPI003969C850